MEWISVKDRLPRMGQDVIVNIMDETEPEGAGTVLPLIFCLDGKYGFHCITINGVEDWSHGVTHWMPLPPAPIK